MTRTFKIIAILSHKWISMATLTPSFPTLSWISESLKTIGHFFQHRQQSKDFKFILEDITQKIFISDLWSLGIVTRHEFCNPMAYCLLATTLYYKTVCWYNKTLFQGIWIKKAFALDHYVIISMMLSCANQQ